MADISQSILAPVVRMNADYNPRIISFYGSTNASGDITLDPGNDRDGSFTAPSRSTNTYTVTVGAYNRFLGIQVSIAGAAAPTLTAVTYNASAGTVTFTTSATVNAMKISVLIIVDRGVDG